jgi:hypothetical protein
MNSDESFLIDNHIAPESAPFDFAEFTAALERGRKDVEAAEDLGLTDEKMPPLEAILLGTAGVLLGVAVVGVIGAQLVIHFGWPVTAFVVAAVGWGWAKRVTR